MESEMEHRLELDTDVLKQDMENGNSLTDLHDIGLFTDSFRAELQKKQRQQRREEKQLQAACFGGENFQKENRIVNQLFIEVAPGRTDYVEIKPDYGIYYMLFGSVFLGVLLCTVMFGRKGRRGDRNAIDNHN